MKYNWTENAKLRYQSLILDQIRSASRILTLIGIILVPSFAFLDYIMGFEWLKELFIIRFATTFVYSVVYFFILRKKTFSHPIRVSFFLLAFSSCSITAMCIVTGGFISPYYAGINLVVLAAVLALPITPKTVTFMVSITIGIYLLGLSLDSFFVGFKPLSFEYFLNNIYFLISTGIIGIAVSYFREKLQREFFDRYLKLEAAQTDLKRSKDLLQADLQTEQVNVESLIKELTERKAQLEKALKFAQTAEDSAQKALNLREEFISLASHELNTPLTVLKLRTQSAKRKVSSGLLSLEMTEKLINSYDMQVKRLIRIVDDMLDISRINTGRLELECSSVEIESMLKDVVERMTEKASAEGTTITINCEGPIYAKWDKFRIEQVLLNLLMNAVKYGNGKPIEISLTSNDDLVIIKVKDQGIGIQKDSLERIFDRFERASVSRNFPGLGLGLYISKQIIQAHGGSIHVESEQGLGSTFTVILQKTALQAFSKEEEKEIETVS